MHCPSFFRSLLATVALLLLVVESVGLELWTKIKQRTHKRKHTLPHIQASILDESSSWIHTYLPGSVVLFSSADTIFLKCLSFGFLLEYSPRESGVRDFRSPKCFFWRAYVVEGGRRWLIFILRYLFLVYEGASSLRTGSSPTGRTNANHGSLKRRSRWISHNQVGLHLIRRQEWTVLLSTLESSSR